MSIAAEKVAEVLALPEEDRAFLARKLVARLDNTVDNDAETKWLEVIDRRSLEIEKTRAIRGCPFCSEAKNRSSIG
jgi:hypothetical protein